MFSLGDLGFGLIRNWILWISHKQLWSTITKIPVGYLPGGRKRVEARSLNEAFQPIWYTVEDTLVFHSMKERYPRSRCNVSKQHFVCHAW